MHPSTLSRRLVDPLVAFAWTEWAQMGVLAAPERHSPWAQDPEAMVVFTLEVARHEPRLFDELLDWLVVSEPLLSVRRLRTMCVDQTDGALTNAALAWLARGRPRARLRGGGDAAGATGPLEPLFHSGGPVTEPDEDFAAAGFLRARSAPSGKSRPPDPLAPINLAFRLRQILGVGVRAEIVRVLVTTDAQRVTAQTLARATGYARRNVHDALGGLTAAGVASAVTVGTEQRYAADRDAWSALLALTPDRAPSHRPWPQLLASLRRILRWAAQSHLKDLSGYLLASSVRDLLESLRPELAFAGVPVGSTASAQGAWRDLDALVAELLAALQAPVALPP
ncbi:MAG: hypothetical protein MSC31_14150 [Solirubrobacteraceae bacterium MAG38_C4-C5]|nr:hypothetical protein [Candidatus Siliceabacter maunaloa]